MAPGILEYTLGYIFLRIPGTKHTAVPGTFFILRIISIITFHAAHGSWHTARLEALRSAVDSKSNVELESTRTPAAAAAVVDMFRKRG